MLKATKFEIIEKRRKSPFDLTSLSDFRLKEVGIVSASEILENPQISLYSLDFDTQLAGFVEIPAGIDMSQVPFMFITQYDEVIRVFTLSFEMFVELADLVRIDESRLVFIHSTGRCGSTLASQVFAQVPGVVNLSEPFVLPELVIMKNSHPTQKDELMALLKATVLLLCKTNAEAAWVIKEHSYALELTGWLGEIFPQAKHLFLYRNAETWMRSCLSAYFGGGEMTLEELRGHETDYRGYKAPLIPVIGQLEAEPHRSFAELMSLEWLNYLERYTQFCEQGMEMLAIRYQDWKREPRKTAEAMLDYCDCRPGDLSAVYAALEQDSQAGTILAQDTFKQKWILTKSDWATMGQILQSHAFINSADYEAINTMR